MWSPVSASSVLPGAFICYLCRMLLLHAKLWWCGDGEGWALREVRARDEEGTYLGPVLWVFRH